MTVFTIHVFANNWFVYSIIYSLKLNFDKFVRVTCTYNDEIATLKIYFIEMRIFLKRYI